MMLPRRLVVPVALVLLAAFLLGGSVAAQDATPTAITGEEQVDVLFVQSFASGRLEPMAEEPGVAVLTLASPIGDTVYFGDRPSRIVGTVAIEEFLQMLDQAAADPPNAALVAEQPAGNVVAVVELIRGEKDAAGALTYQVRVLTAFDEVDMELSEAPLTELTDALELGAGHLIIDGLTQHKDNPT